MDQETDDVSKSVDHETGEFYIRHNNEESNSTQTGHNELSRHMQSKSHRPTQIVEKYEDNVVDDDYEDDDVLRPIPTSTPQLTNKKYRRQRQQKVRSTINAHAQARRADLSAEQADDIVDDIDQAHESEYHMMGIEPMSRLEPIEIEDEDEDEDEDDDEADDEDETNNQLDIRINHKQKKRRPPLYDIVSNHIPFSDDQTENPSSEPFAQHMDAQDHLPHDTMQQNLTDHQSHPENLELWQQQTPYHKLSRQNKLKVLMSAFERLDPDKNDLKLVPKEITSSTLTTRLKAVCRINQHIEHSNYFSELFGKVGEREKFKESIDKLRNWILDNKIIEHIFGPNCHVEIIKQSHIILNFVAQSLDNDHVNVIWSASSLKHCGRQVLDLLTSLVRFMRAGPVLHLYWLVKNLNVGDHSDHTLLLASHILRFIWSHSPCINQPNVEVEQIVVNQMLKTMSEPLSNSPSQQSKQSQDDEPNHHRHFTDQLFNQDQHQLSPTNLPLQSNLDTEVKEQEWLDQWRGNDFLDNTSDVSACCSEDKNMDDFDDDEDTSVEYSNEDDQYLNQAQRQQQKQSDTTIWNDDPTGKNDALYSPSNSQANSHRKSSQVSVDNSPSMSIPGDTEHPQVDNKLGMFEINDSTSTSRDSESKLSKLYQDNEASNLIGSHPQSPLASVARFKELKKALACSNYRASHASSDDDMAALSEYNLSNLSDPGKTLLWDLLQDGKIELLTSNLHIEIENVLVNLVMSFGDKYIRYKFIEACLENLSNGTSVIISLRLLPKLMSFNTITRNLSIPAINETHTIVLWVEKEYNMSRNFFKNLVEYYEQRRQMLCSKLLMNSQSDSPPLTNEQLMHLEEYGDLSGKDSMFSHIDKIITRMSFLTFIYSKPFSPDSMKLTKEQMDQLWDCLANDSNLRCSDVLFQWIYQQAIGDDFHGVNDELLDYVLKHKLPTLDAENFRLRGLKLLEQLLWIRQDYECCHGLEHPATRLLWDIALKAVDDEVSMAAIRILNHFYIYTNHQKSTKCDKGINFMSHCMDQLQISLNNLSAANDSNEKNINQLLDVMQKVILLIRTHLEVFKAHWSFYLRILQLNNEADLISHRLKAYEIKLTMTIRLVCQAASRVDKTTIEVQVGDFVGELRAEIVKWWYSQVDRSYFEQTATAHSPSPSISSTISSSSSQNSSTIDGIKPKSRLDSNDTSDPPGDSNTLHGFTEFLMANHHSLRLLSHNQEIPFEWDERQINELDFKDMQVIYVLSDLKSVPNGNPMDTSSADDLVSNKSNETFNHIPKSEVPSILLLRHEYFERLMETDRFLGAFQSDNLDLANRAKTLSRRVWEIIQILPTCPTYKENLKRCGNLDQDWSLKTPQCANLLSARCPQRLLYSLQIIDILRSYHEIPIWGANFIRKGGLGDLYDVFMSQKLLPNVGEDWNEWLQECLACLLKLLFRFGIKTSSLNTMSNHQQVANESSSSSTSSKMNLSISIGHRTTSGSSSSSAGSVKRVRRNRARLMGTSEERLPIPQFSEELLKLLAKTDLVFDKLLWILKSSAFCQSQSDQYYYVTVSSRAMIVHHVMNFLSSWCKSDPKFPRFNIADHEQLLKALILNDTDSSTRREACNGFYKLHLASSSRYAIATNNSVESINSTINSSLNTSASSSLSKSFSLISEDGGTYQPWSYSINLLECLIKFLPIAEKMKPPKPIRNYLTETDYIKDLNSPGCKDYFWLTCRLIDSPWIGNLNRADKIPPSTGDTLDNPAMESNDNQKPIQKDSEMSSTEPTDSRCSLSGSVINLFELCEYLVDAIHNRQTYETRDFTVEDDTLRGMLQMMCIALRRDHTFKYTTTAFDFIHELYDYLFAQPSASQRYLPKCKSPATRSTAFDLMIALVERCPRNYFGLLELLLVDQHNSVVENTYPTDYWPHDDCRSEVGFVGLINLGATCYLATCMQHLFMIPNLRYAILGINDTRHMRHGEIIRELQKIFTFMLESERKAYNPRNFCRVYTMDNHPLNIAEQTDMTEFLTDLITKLEESSPDLRQIIKGIFSGTLSNNVVSLDCPHISRTSEEFYTLRVQVADMRNLNDSLDELTVKDTLEGDNMYTCSTCEKKVRAEKRACIVKLPRILCFNTMRYTFNMATMTKEKVNTHFSFPLKLDMADYLEENLMKRQQSSTSSATRSSSSSSTSSSSTSSLSQQRDTTADQQADGSSENPSPSSPTDDKPKTAGGQTSTHGSGEDEETKDSETMYDLIGVTVHTGNADGGHYYCFIRDCEDQSAGKPRWYLFNDAEVKPFDDSHLGTECYGGELTTKSYDAINDRFMDFSIEKTNSAYMLFYKRVDYKYHSKSVALRYLESDTQRNQVPDEIRLLNSSRSLSTTTTTSPGSSDDTGIGRGQQPSGARGWRLRQHRNQRMATAAAAAAETTQDCRSNSEADNPSSGDLAGKYANFLGRDKSQPTGQGLNFNDLCHKTYDDFELPSSLADWIWADNMKFSRDKNVFEHNYFNFMWQLCANVPRTLSQVPEHLAAAHRPDEATSKATEDAIAIGTVHLAIAFVLGVLMNSRERPNLSNWTDLIKRQFNSSKEACDWLMHLIDDEETWLKQMLLKCPIEMVRQLFQRLCNDLSGSKQHKKLRLIR